MGWAFAHLPPYSSATGPRNASVTIFEHLMETYCDANTHVILLLNAHHTHNAALRIIAGSTASQSLFGAHTHMIAVAVTWTCGDL